MYMRFLVETAGVLVFRLDLMPKNLQQNNQQILTPSESLFGPNDSSPLRHEIQLQDD